MAFGLFIARPYEHRYPPEPKEFYEVFVDSPASLIDKWLGAARAEAFEANVRLAKFKERFYWLMLSAIVLAAAASTASITL